MAESIYNTMSFASALFCLFAIRHAQRTCLSKCTESWRRCSCCPCGNVCGHSATGWCLQDLVCADLT